jgi:AraC-like DNA-binding protein
MSFPNTTDATVRSHAARHPAGGRLQVHAHGWDQLTLLSGRAVLIETKARYFVQPGDHALWIPAGALHAVVSSKAFTLQAVYFQPRAVALPREPSVVALSPLLRELVLFLCATPAMRARTSAHDDAARLLTALLTQAEIEPFGLIRPADPRAQRLAARFIERPDDPRSIERIAQEAAGASVRTLERLFLAQTGLSMVAWRRRVRLLIALGLISDGAPAASAAAAVGYNSAAAFSTAFKASFGRPPSTFSRPARERPRGQNPW